MENWDRELLPKTLPSKDDAEGTEADHLGDHTGCFLKASAIVVYLVVQPGMAHRSYFDGDRVNCRRNLHDWQYIVNTWSEINRHGIHLLDSRG